MRNEFLQNNYRKKILIQRLGIEIEDEVDEDKFSSNSDGLRLSVLGAKSYACTDRDQL